MTSSPTSSDPAAWNGDKKAYTSLLRELTSLQQELIALEKESEKTLAKVEPRHLGSAANLVHYLGLRRRDVRSLQDKLTAIGLSSLGRAESRVLRNLHAIIVLLQRALDKPVDPMPPTAADPSVTGSTLLEANTGNLLGKVQSQRHGRIMVTLPENSADDYALIKEMLLHGMDCARINCAHGDPGTWTRMIKQIRRASRETGRRCRILMDLAGPKLRTGEIAFAPPVLKWQPQRDVCGKVVAPARIWIISARRSLPSFPVGFFPAPREQRPAGPACGKGLARIYRRARCAAPAAAGRPGKPGLLGGIGTNRLRQPGYKTFPGARRRQWWGAGG